MIHFVIVGVLVILSTGAVYYGLTNIRLLPEQASQQAVVIDSLFDIQWLLISFFFSLIIVFLVYSVIVFRRRQGELGEGDHFEENTPLEVIWTVVPLVIVLGLAVIGADKLRQVESRDPGALVVNVTAQQFGWTFEYPEYEISSGELFLPVNQQVLLRLSSRDVIHSFWVPEFRVKQDVLPGGEAYVRELRITPIEEGTFKVRCAELCGTGHATMLANVTVEAKADFDQWVLEQTCQGTVEECNGKQWAIEFGCVACHQLDGSEVIAPTWVGLFGTMETMDDGTQTVVDEEYLRLSIMDPMAHIVEGFTPVMPQDYGEKLTEQQINELIAFIMSLAQ